MSDEKNYHLGQILEELGFGTLTLEELESLKLLNRQDKKYIFHISHLGRIFGELAENYLALEISSNKVFNYYNTYYDTKEHLLYKMHHNGNLGRFKIRHRCYTDIGKSYLEIKIKTNKNFTNKRRIANKNNNLPKTMDKNSAELIEENTGIDPKTLEPKLNIGYSRITLVNRKLAEKVTLDYNIIVDRSLYTDNGTLQNNQNGLNSQRFGSLKDSQDGKLQSELKELVIAEVKQSKMSEGSDFQRLMRDLKIRPESISKYCVGSMLAYPKLKYNRFKEKMMLIDKICGEYNGI